MALGTSSTSIGNPPSGSPSTSSRNTPRARSFSMSIAMRSQPKCCTSAPTGACPRRCAARTRRTRASPARPSTPPRSARRRAWPSARRACRCRSSGRCRWRSCTVDLPLVRVARQAHLAAQAAALARARARVLAQKYAALPPRAWWSPTRTGRRGRPSPPTGCSRTSARGRRSGTCPASTRFARPLAMAST